MFLINLTAFKGLPKARVYLLIFKGRQIHQACTRNTLGNEVPLNVDPDIEYEEIKRCKNAKVRLA